MRFQIVRYDPSIQEVGSVRPGQVQAAPAEGAQESAHEARSLHVRAVAVGGRFRKVRGSCADGEAGMLEIAGGGDGWWREVSPSGTY